MNLPKKQGQRLIPEYLLKYNEELQKNHPDPTAPWGGGSGSDYTAGEGIDITDHVISIDDSISVTNLEVVNNSKGIDLYSGTADSTNAKLGFTLYNNVEGNTSNYKEVGFLEANSSRKETLLGYYNTSNAEAYKDWNLGFEYYGRVTDGQSTKLTNLRLFVPNKMNTTGDPIHYIPVKFKIGSGTSYEADNTGIVTLPSYPTVPTNVSSFTNDAGYITNSALNGYATQLWVTNQGYSTFSGSYNDLTDKPTIPTDTSDLTNGAGFITSSALSGYATETWVSTQGYITGIDYSDVITALGYIPGTSNFSGDYTDLTNKPTIPTATSDLTNDSGFITSSSLPDMTNYYTKTEINTNYYDRTDVDDIVDNVAADIPEIFANQPNPTTPLTSLSINNTNYSIPTVPTYYEHVLTLRDASTSAKAIALTTIRNRSNTPFTIDTLKQWLYDNGFRTTQNGVYPASGQYTPTSTTYAIYAIRSTDGTKVDALSNNGSTITITQLNIIVDIVLPL